jgi:hypothetical protein
VTTVTRPRHDRSLSFGSAAAAYERGRPYPPKLVASREGIDDILANLQLGFDAARKYRSPAIASVYPQAVAAL